MPDAKLGHRVTTTLALLATLVLPSACGEAGAQAVVEVEAADFPCASGDVDAWESAPWPDGSDACTWLRYEGRTTYRIAHELGQVPRSVQVYLSFDENGAASAASAGDMARIVAVTDTHVELRNATNQRFFLRVVVD
ncbi:MAG: hypothetical protein H6722_18195 [Sandaracinus sp.]|nr:hypothetical protein [Sandaracinus sp.]MCB9614372.1 hypothetical protein [Sandaracinus sp.]